MALWHWSLNLQAKVLYAWRFWVAERQRKERRLAAAAQFYRDELLQEGVTHILTYAAHMSAFSTNMALHSHEQSSRQLQAVVRRCALRWKQRALCKPSRVVEANKDDPPPKTKKSVSFSLPEGHTQSHTFQPIRSPATEHTAGDSTVSKLLLVRASRLQPRRPDDLLYSPAKDLLQHPEPRRHSHTDNHYKATHPASNQLQNAGQNDARHSSSAPAYCPPHSVSLPFTQPQSPGLSLSTMQQPPVLNIKPPILAFRSGLTGNSASAENQEVLLPPSSFTASISLGKQTRSRHKYPSLLSPQDFIHSNLPGQTGVCENGFVEAEAEDNEETTLLQTSSYPTEALNTELHNIRLDLQRYQQDRTQLQSWRKLQKIMRNWLQTTGSDADTEERESILQEVNELDIRISSLSEKIAERKHIMICHAARVSSIESQLLRANVKI